MADADLRRDVDVEEGAEGGFLKGNPRSVGVVHVVDGGEQQVGDGQHARQADVNTERFAMCI